MNSVTRKRYALPSLLLHWLCALLILAAYLIALKFWLQPLSPTKLKLLSWHKWVGISVLILVLLRLIARLAYRAPALPEHMPAPEQRMAHIGHGVLYLLMLAIPLSGWAMSSAYGIPVILFGQWPLPDLVAPAPQLATQLKWLHWGLDLLLALAIVGHIAMALKHHFIDRDGLLQRMLPGNK